MGLFIGFCPNQVLDSVRHEQSNEPTDSNHAHRNRCTVVKYTRRPPRVAGWIADDRPTLKSRLLCFIVDIFSGVLLIKGVRQKKEKATPHSSKAQI